MLLLCASTPTEILPPFLASKVNVEFSKKIRVPATLEIQLMQAIIRVVIHVCKKVKTAYLIKHLPLRAFKISNPETLEGILKFFYHLGSFRCGGPCS